MKPIVVEVPMVTVRGNPREHWAVRSKRVASERGKVARRMPSERPGPLLEVRLTRCAPRALDLGDNLASSMKGVRDQVATWLRIDDASPLVRWSYHQEKTEKGKERVRIEVESMGGGMPSLGVRTNDGPHKLPTNSAVSQAFREHEAEVERIAASVEHLDESVWERPRMKALLAELQGATKAPKDETPAERIRRLAKPNRVPAKGGSR